MSLQFFLVEDDPVTRKMLEKIVTESGLGEIAGQAEDGRQVTYEQVRDVDIILIDLLMPGRDGIETMKALSQEGFRGKFIMISQVENKEMVGEAYLHGVDTFIQKPVNRLEVLSVLKRAADHLALSTSLHSIRESLSILEGRENPLQARTEQSTSLEKKVQNLLLQLGIAGETGAHDLLLITRWIQDHEQNSKFLKELPQLKELYANVLELPAAERAKADIHKEVRAMEQRIRRMVLHAFTNLASLGLTDFANPTFEYFAPRLFDFEEIRKRMKEIQNGLEHSNCRISVRKFLAAFYMEIKNQ